MGEPSTLAAPLSPRALAAAQHVTAIEAELVQLRAEVAPTLERIAALERSLEAVELAAHPKQAALLDIGEALPPVSPLREPSRMAETLLRRAAALAAEGEVGMPRLVIARDAVSRGELKCAHALAAGIRPLLVEESCTKAAKVYRLTADGETVAQPPRLPGVLMNAPILFMLAAPTCPAGWHPVPGAQPSRAGDAVALVLPSLYPIESAEITSEQAAMLAACLPPEGYAPARTDAGGERMTPGTLAPGAPDGERFGGLWFARAALSFVRLAHPSVRWSYGGADGFHDITEIDLLHGWVEGRCVAVVCRLAPSPESL